MDRFFHFKLFSDNYLSEIAAPFYVVWTQIFSLNHMNKATLAFLQFFYVGCGSFFLLFAQSVFLLKAFFVISSVFLFLLIFPRFFLLIEKLWVRILMKDEGHRNYKNKKREIIYSGLYFRCYGNVVVQKKIVFLILICCLNVVISNW